MESKSLFLSLPYELRYEIYLYCIPTQRIVDTDYCFLIICPSHAKSNLVLLRVCKQASEECLDILYGENLFFLLFHLQGESNLKRITESNRNRIRHLLAAMTSTAFIPSPVPLDASLWASVLSNLRQFCFVTLQPQTFETAEFTGWPGSFESLLRCFAQYLPREAVVQVEHNGREPTQTMSRTYLPGSLEKIDSELEEKGLDNAVDIRLAAFMNGSSRWHGGIISFSRNIPRRKGLFVF